jgi:redox-sensing transcriptional repressor
MSQKIIPDVVISRLPRYLQILQRMSKDNVHTASSKELGKRLGISAAQIRKDLSQFGEFGKQGTGYSIPFLIDQIEKILNIQRSWNIVLIGAGNLGHAIVRYQGFSKHGFCIEQVFDSDPKKIGQMVEDLVIQDITDMPEKVRQSGIQVAMLTVPAGEAQELAETLVKAGVQAILNYAPTVLNLPDQIQVEYIDPVVKLQHMTYYLK